MKTAKEIINAYKNGQRYFPNVEMENENFDGEILDGIIFENCILFSSFQKTSLRNAKFINGNIKTCDFKGADLTNVHFENVLVECVEFDGAKKEGVYFENNWCYGHRLNQKHFDNWKD